MNGKFYLSSVALLSVLAVNPAESTELVYTPINPSFGGSPLNGSFLLSKAQGQNKHKAEFSEKSYAERFQESLERAYINKMVREITDSAFPDSCAGNADPDCLPNLFGEDSMFVSGDYQVQIVTSGADSITVEITNSVTGEITIIEVPRFGQTG